MFYLTALLTVAPFCVIPVAAGTGTTLLLVNVFPARRARDILMLMGLVFAGSIVLLLRFIQPERLLRVESLPDVTGFLRDAAIADHAAAAVVLGGRDAVCEPGGRPRPAACGRAVDDGVRVDGDAERGERALVLRRLQQLSGGAEGALHPAGDARRDRARCCRCRSCAAICSSRT